MSGLSGSLNCGRETHCGSDYGAICSEMLFGYVLAETANGICHDVSLHASVEVCLRVRFTSLWRSGRPIRTAQTSRCLLYTSPSPRTPEHLVCRLLLEKKN